MMDAEQERNWAIACHLSSLAWIPLSAVGLGAIPFVNLIAPALVWYAKKDESELVNEHGKESLNFQISMTIYGFAAGVLSLILLMVVAVFLLAVGASEGNPVAVLLGIISGFGLVLAVVLIVAIAIFQLVVVIFAALRANEGDMYRYPFNLRLL
ncbi:MAG: DUF4870 domain-containing protein [Limnothrix sp.]